MYVVIISCSIRSDSSYCLITSVKKELGVDFFTKGEEVLGVWVEVVDLLVVVDEEGWEEVFGIEGYQKMSTKRGTFLLFR